MQEESFNMPTLNDLQLHQIKMNPETEAKYLV
jgi:hypothetical protein